MFQSGQYCHCFPEATPVYSKSISNLYIFPPKYLSSSTTSLDFPHHPVSSYCIFFLGPIVTSIHTCSSPPPPQKSSSKQRSDYVTLLLNTHSHIHTYSHIFISHLQNRDLSMSLFCLLHSKTHTHTQTFYLLEKALHYLFPLTYVQASFLPTTNQHIKKKKDILHATYL